MSANGNEAVLDRVIAAHTEGKGAEEVAAVRERVKKMITEMKPQDAEGLKTLLECTYALAIDGVRALMRHMVEASGAEGERRAALLARIEDISPIKDATCMRVDYFSATTRKMDSAYIRLDEVQADYDFGAELARLRAAVNPEKWDEVMKAVSSVFNVGRMTYARLASENVALVCDIMQLEADDKRVAPLLQLVVDTRNSTLLLRPEWPKRVGVRIHLQSELPKNPEVGL